MESKKFNREVCIRNIYFLAKEKGIRIGELEKYAEVRAGYLSRWLKAGEDRKRAFSAKTLFLMAKKLGVTMDMLIKADLEKLNPTEMYFMKFLDKVIIDSRSGRLYWNKELVTCSLKEGHPLLNRKTNNEVYLLKDNKVESKIIENIYHTKFLHNEDVVMYLCKVENFCNKNEESYELYFAEGGEAFMVLNSYCLCEGVCSRLRDLYQALEEEYRCSVLSREARDAIESYLSSDERYI